MISVLFLCTGNATRSVLAGAALRARLPHLEITTAGTLTVDGCPISIRTRAAFGAVALDVPSHKSKQAHQSHLDAADLVVALDPEHVKWVRRAFPQSAYKTGTLRRLARDLQGGPITDEINRMRLADVTLEAWEEVVDPGGMEADAYVTCAHDVVALIDTLAVALGASSAESSAESSRTEA